MSSLLRGCLVRGAQLFSLSAIMVACASEPLAEGNETIPELAAQAEPPSADSQCGQIRENAEVSRGKTDIVWLIDTSPSMIDEQQKVRANITKFMADFEKSNADARAVMVTMPDPAAGTPLASDSSRYRFVFASVYSRELYTVALATFNSYQDFLRKDAVTHFVMVTDDDDKVPAESFRTQMEQRLGRKFIQHAIASESVNGRACTTNSACPAGGALGGLGGILGGILGGGGAQSGGGQPGGGFPGGAQVPGLCGGAAAVGAAYNTLADATKGEKISICSSDWNEVFTRLREAVISATPLPCDYAIPQAAGVFDPAQVNATFTPSDGKQTKLARIPGKAQCGDKQGWHFDDEAMPERIVLCASTCAAAQKGGSISIKLGCLAQ